MAPKMPAWSVGIAVAGVCALVVAAVTNTTAWAMPWCTPDSLTVNTGPYGAPGDSSQIHFDVILTNIAEQACALQGYPGVDLVGPDDPMWGPVYSLPRQSGDPQPLTIAPGASASSRLTFLPAPDGWVPTFIVVTPPDATTSLEVPWIPGGVGVLRQDGATSPGTYIGPLEPTG
ncbi:hypothetical protein BST36_26430 [Mycolicibacterium moriokaense]|nr:DUF4232 domain-containing protein [Mycolicibacterium moriokaense]ORB16043.1 hypothetical protein BST36_26430 [Mycolicibacterium moriokaense]